MPLIHDGAKRSEIDNKRQMSAFSAKAYREIFIARKGYTFIETDLSQAELRIAAWMANERVMLRIYREGGDIHSMTTAAIMGLSLKQFMALDEETRELKRFQAKAV